MLFGVLFSAHLNECGVVLNALQCHEVISIGNDGGHVVLGS
jgi:hypothetical protein